MDIGRIVPDSSGTPSPGDVDSDDALSSANISQQRMLYVTVEHNEDSYPFHQPRVSPLDPNLNSAQFSPNTQNTSLLNHAHRDITTHNTNLQFSNPNEQIANIVTEHFSQANSGSHEIDEYNKTLSQSEHITQNLLDNANFSTHGSSILSSEASRTIYNYVTSLGEIETNLVANGTNLVEFNSPESSLEQMQQIPSDFINIDAAVNDTLTSSAYVTNLNSSFILKQNINGKYYQQILNSDIVHLPYNLIPHNNIIITENAINGRLSDDILTDLHDNCVLADSTDGVINLQENEINRNDLTGFINNQMMVNHVVSNKTHKPFKQNGIRNINSLKKYNVDLNINKNKKYMMKNAVFSINSQMTTKKPLNMKRKMLNSDALLEVNGIDPVPLNTDTGLSDTFVTTTNMYDPQTNFDFPDNEDTCTITSSDRNDCVIGEAVENNAGSDYLVLDAGLYTLNGFKTQGFFVEQTSGDVMVCQEIDSELAIDQSMSDSKFNQLLNQDLNLSLNYNDQLILDNSDERFETENNLIDKDKVIANGNEHHNLDANVNVGQNIENVSEIHDLVLENNIPLGDVNSVSSKEEDNINNCIKLELEATATVDGDSIEALDNIRRSTRSQKVQEKNEKKDIFTICDKQVPSRAWASLPASYLTINKINVENEDAFGVFTRKTIPSRTQFGPVEGVKLVLRNPVDDNKFTYQIKSEDEVYFLDISDEESSNWMRFVRPADSYSAQNLVMTEESGCLYFTTLKSIGPKSELRVWYGEEYANEYGFKLLEPSEEEKKALADLEYSWNCFECNQRFKSSELLHKHMNVHDERKVDSEGKCKRLARRARSVLTKKFHIYKIDPENIPTKHTCYICNRVFPRQSSLSRHLLIHKNDNIKKENGTYTSDNEEQYKENKNVPINKIEEVSNNGDVKKNFDSKIAINNDIIIKEEVYENPKTTVIIKSKEDKKIYKCPECPKAFVMQDRLEHHLMIHQEDAESNKLFQCSQCLKKFMNSSALLCHEKTHQTLKCPMCDEIFNLVPALREHVKVHCVDGFFTCSHCKKQFSKYSLIRKHIRAFHSERKLPCPQCAKPFPTKDKLRMHLLRHSNHREFLCAQCGEQFKRKDKLQGHMKKVHAPKPIQTENKPHQYVDLAKLKQKIKRFMPKVSPSDYHRFIYKCHSCLLGFKRRGMLVNHLAKRHPDIRPESVPELNLPILRTTRDYYCQYCLKVYKSSSKRKAHILKNHPGQELPLSNRHKGGIPNIPGVPNPTFSQTVGSVTTHPHACLWCHKQYASKAKLLQHQRKKHADLLTTMQQINDNLPSDLQQNINDDLYLMSEGDNQDDYFKIVAPNQMDVDVNHDQSNLNLLNSSNEDMDFELNPDDPDVINKIPESKSEYLTIDLKVDKNGLLHSAINVKSGFENESIQPFEKPYEEEKIVRMSQHNGENKIIINVSELDHYNKLSNKPSNLLKSLLTVPELIPIKVENDLNKSSKKWVNNFPFSPYTQR